MADLRNSTTYRNNTKFASGWFEPRMVPTSSDIHDKDFKLTEELFWVAERPRTNGGQPEDTPRRWADIEGDERRAIMPIYEAYIKGMDAPVDGTPLKSWAALVPALLEGLLRNGIRTVEQLADAPQTVVQSCGMGCLQLQVKAQRFVEEDKSRKIAQGEAAALREQLAAQAAQMEDLQKQLAALSAGGTITDAERAALTRKKPGPKPKVKEDAGHMSAG